MRDEDTDSYSGQSSSRGLSWQFWVALVVVVGLWAGLGYLVPNWMAKGTQRGILGDAFGGVAALFSGLAFVGVIYAILQQRDQLQLQRKDLELQRQELRLTRQEFEEQTEALNLQASVAERQVFTSAFFEMFGAMRELRSEARYARHEASAAVRAVNGIVWDKIQQVSETEALPDGVDVNLPSLGATSVEVLVRHICEVGEILDNSTLEETELASFRRLLMANVQVEERALIVALGLLRQVEPGSLVTLGVLTDSDWPEDTPGSVDDFTV